MSSSWVFAPLTSHALSVAFPKFHVQIAIGSTGVLSVVPTAGISLYDDNIGAETIPAATVLEFLRNFLLFMGLVLYF